MNNFANSLHKDQARQNVGPDLDPNRLTMTDIKFKKSAKHAKHLSTFSLKTFVVWYLLEASHQCEMCLVSNQIFFLLQQKPDHSNSDSSKHPLTVTQIKLWI